MLSVANLTAAMQMSFDHMPYYNVCGATSLLRLGVLSSCPDKQAALCQVLYTYHYEDQIYMFI